jgi:hypothetical protein
MHVVVGRCHPVRGSLRFAVLLAAVTSVAALPASAVAKKKTSKKAVGVVYTETNNPKRNQVQIFKRFANGKLQFVKAVSTGGKGGDQLQPGCAPTCPFLDTQGEVNLSSDGHHVFAVNAGSNTVSSFITTPGGLKLVDVKPSGGKFPNSIATHGNVLYVLDSGIFPMPGPPVPGNVAGFHFNAAGHLTPIKGSNRPLTATVPGLARQVGFNNQGTVLIATLLGNPNLMPPVATDSIDTFKIAANGSASPATAHDATTAFPFGFAFDPSGHLIMSQVSSLTTPGAGDTASYKVSSSGALSSISTKPTKGTAPCWVSITSDGRYAFVVNTGGGAPAFTTSFRIAPNGGLTFLANTPVLKGEFALTDETLSADNHYLYVLAAAPPPTLAHHIDEYKVLANGHLKLIGKTPDMQVPGTSGLAGL